MSANRTDADIQRDVVESLYWDVRLDSADVGVTVEEGRVTLLGSVPTYRARSAAREDALVIRDVVDVENRLQVEVSPDLDTPDDTELESTVRDVLDADPDLAAADVEVEVEKGTVHLSGSVPTFWERELARSVAVTLPGVRGLVNEVVVVPEGDHDDVVLARTIADTMARNRHVDLSDVDIEVVRGHVTLSGQVPDDGTREQVLDAARHTEGVTEITDLLQLPPNG